MPTNTPITVLVVDDVEASRYTLARMLRRANFTVLEAATGEEALRLVAQLPDLVILDVNLPDLSGYEVCKKIKTDPATAPTRVKQLRDRVYLICGIVMLASLALAGIASLPFATALNSLNPVFWLESIAIVAFGVSWLVKGQVILRDKQPLAAGRSGTPEPLSGQP